MLVEMALVGGYSIFAYKILNHVPKDEKEVKNKWKELMYHTQTYNKSDTENKLNIESYKIEKYIKKHYGFDLIVVMPYGLNYDKLYRLKPDLQTIYGGDIDMHYVKGGKDKVGSAYLQIYNGLR